jgi:hypothetical protein
MDRSGVEMMGKVLTISTRYMKVRTHVPLDPGRIVEIDCGDNMGLGEVIQASPGDGCFVCVVKIEHALNRKAYGRDLPQVARTQAWPPVAAK